VTDSEVKRKRSLKFKLLPNRENPVERIQDGRAGTGGGRWEWGARCGLRSAATGTYRRSRPEQQASALDVPIYGNCSGRRWAKRMSEMVIAGSERCFGLCERGFLLLRTISELV
jgi:hypothetical protein